MNQAAGPSPADRREATAVGPPPAALPGGVTVRPGVLEDAEAIGAIERASFADERERFGFKKIRALLRSPRALVLVAGNAGGTLGWLAAFTPAPPRRDWGRVFALAVHPAARGMKLGTILMELALADLRRRGAGRVFLEVRAGSPAAGLYRKLGFVDVRDLPDYYGSGLHARRMVRMEPGGKE